MSKRRLLFFGWPRLEVDGNPERIKSRKGLALLSYLAVSKKTENRDFLAGMLWPEFGQTRARANLRRTLYQLNQTLIAQWLNSDPDNIGLAPGGNNFIDVIKFADHLKLDTIKDLAQAVTLYTADFLSSFHLMDSDHFNEWSSLQ